MIVYRENPYSVNLGILDSKHTHQKDFIENLYAMTHRRVNTCLIFCMSGNRTFSPFIYRTFNVHSSRIRPFRFINQPLNQ